MHYYITLHIEIWIQIYEQKMNSENKKNWIFFEKKDDTRKS